MHSKKMSKPPDNNNNTTSVSDDTHQTLFVDLTFMKKRLNNEKQYTFVLEIENLSQWSFEKSSC
jgi:hypothetical protein